MSENYTKAFDLVFDKKQWTKEFLKMFCEIKSWQKEKLARRKTSAARGGRFMLKKEERSKLNAAIDRNWITGFKKN